MLEIRSVEDPAFAPYGRVWGDADSGITGKIAHALEKDVPLPDGVGYVMDDPALSGLSEARELAPALFGGRPVQFGWCCGHNTKLNCLEYHRSSEFNLGSRDFILLLARLDEVHGGCLDTSCVQAFRVPANTLVEVYATTLHYAPCQVDEGGFRVLVALPEGTNAPLEGLESKLPGIGDAPLLWAQDKWLLAHAESDEAHEGAHVGLAGENIDIAGFN